MTTHYGLTADGQVTSERAEVATVGGHSTCPFTAAVNDGCTASEILRLAAIVKAAHCSDDVWAGIRVERALRGYLDAGLGGYLYGKHFESWLDADSHVIVDLGALRDLARNFYLTGLG